MTLAKYLPYVLAAATVMLPFQPVAANTNLTQEAAVTPERVSQARSRPFTLTFGQRKWTVSAAEVSKWFKTRRLDDSTLALQLRPGAIYDYLNIHVSPRVNQLGERSRFVMENGKPKVVELGRKGSIVDGIKTSLAVRAALVQGKNSVSGAMKEHRPDLFSVQEFAKLRFPNLLARGETNFAGSPRNRIHNIRVATQKYHGLVIMPGEEFSFNQYLGNVDAANGYLPELVIKENVTTPEYGGGICQVSTTVFRAALQAGLQIKQRRNHSYPVRYYGTPGYDATVYAPSTDFTFVNDLTKPIYITTAVEGTKVKFDFWGTTDGRQVTVNGPFVTQRSPDGSLTAAVAQIIKKDGKTLREQNFVSRYQSPSKFPTIRSANGE